LATCPIVFFAEVIEDVLNFQSESSVCWFFSNDLVSVSLSDNVVDSVFEGIESEFIGIGKLPTVGTEEVERFVHGKEKGVRDRS